MFDIPDLSNGDHFDIFKFVTLLTLAVDQTSNTSVGICHKDIFVIACHASYAKVNFTSLGRLNLIEHILGCPH